MVSIAEANMKLPQILTTLAWLGWSPTIQGPLPDRVEQQLDLGDHRGIARGDDVQLPGRGGFGAPEHRRGEVGHAGLSVQRRQFLGVAHRDCRAIDMHRRKPSA
jgi:hypothetical protein